MSNSSQTIAIQSAAIVQGTTTVQLTYSNGDGNVTEIDGAGSATITYQLSDPVFRSGWSIVGYAVDGVMPADMSAAVATNASGNALVIVDHATATGTEQFSFLIRLSLGGVTYTSTDPVICNEPD